MTRRVYYRRQGDRFNVMLGVNISRDLNFRIEAAADDAQRSKSDFIRIIIEAGLKAHRACRDATTDIAVRAQHSPSDDRSQAGFMLAPLLYMLALGGIGAAVMFSGYSQVLRSNAEMTAVNAVRQQLSTAAQTLSASSQLTSGNTILTPPSVTAFAAVTDTARLPGSYATVNATGTPTAYGVLDTASGVRQLDPWGKYYLYCKWDSAIATGTNPSISVISAGPDGTLQSKCGDNAAVGDDRVNKLSVAEAINRANVWQVNTSSQVQFGNTASAVKVDSIGNMNVDSLAVGSGATATSGNVYALGNVRGATMTSAGALTAGSISTAGTLSAGATSLSSLSLASALSLANGGTGATTAAAARTNLGATVTGAALFTTVSAGAARTTLGSTATGDALFTTASAAAARTTLGSTATGDALFTSASAAVARTTLGLGTMATQNANAVAITGGTIDGVTITGSTMSGAATVAGSNGQVQFNNSGNLGADSAFLWDNTSKQLRVNGYIISTGANAGLLLGGRDGSAGYQWYSNLGGAALWDNTNSAARITVDGSGNVGIGTTAPGSTLDVRAATSAVTIRSTTTTNVANLQLYNNGYTYLGRERSAGGNFFAGSAAYASVFGSADAYPVQLATNGTVRMSVDSAGNVGIGTTTPDNKLTVASGGIGLNYATASNSGGIGLGPDASSGSYNFSYTNSQGTFLTRHYGMTILANASPEVYLAGYGGLGLITGGINRLHITTSGNVGIGTTTPLAKLDVRNGSILAGDVSSTNGGVILQGYYSGSDTTAVFGTQRSSGAPVLGYGVRPSTSAAGSFLSSASTALPRAALVVGDAATGTGDIKFYTGSSQTVAPGSAATLLPVLTILNSGNVGIGTTSPGAKLVVAGDIYSNNYYHNSDRRLKSDIKRAAGLDIVTKLNGVTFNWKKGGTPSAGVIAQETEAVFPVAVATDNHGVKLVSYDTLIAPLIEAVKELKADNDNLRVNVKALGEAFKAYKTAHP